MTETSKPKPNDKPNDKPLTPHCPECDTELVMVNDKPPESCAKCGFTLEGYDTFFRWFKKAMTAYEEGRKPPEPPKDEKVLPVRKTGVLSRLGRRG